MVMTTWCFNSFSEVTPSPCCTYHCATPHHHAAPYCVAPCCTHHHYAPCNHASLIMIVLVTMLNVYSKVSSCYNTLIRLLFITSSHHLLHSSLWCTRVLSLTPCCIQLLHLDMWLHPFGVSKHDTSTMLYPTIRLHLLESCPRLA